MLDSDWLTQYHTNFWLARVRITVNDVNDNDPQFVETEKTIYFDENEPAESRVFRASAKDRDSGENAHISYSIANINAEEIPFDIDHTTGVIKSRRLIDYETDKREYKLQIRASDWGTPFRRQSEMRLRIRIKDINDNRPQVCVCSHHFILCSVLWWWRCDSAPRIAN